MGILNIQVSQAGLVGVVPNPIYINTNDTYTTVTTAGYLNEAHQQGYAFSNEQMALVYTSDEGPVWLKVTVNTSTQTYSLEQISSPGDVVLPTIANNIIVSTDTAGTLANTTATAINRGSIQAGLSGDAGTLISYSATAARGSLVVAAVANTGDTVTTVSNAAMGQATLVSIPDPADAAGMFLVGATATPFVSGNFPVASGTAGLMIDSGVAAADLQQSTNIIAAQSADIGGGGAGPINIVNASVTANSVIVASIVSSTNTVAVGKVAPGAGSFDVTFTADPGAACVISYVIFVAAQ